MIFRRWNCWLFVIAAVMVCQVAPCPGGTGGHIVDTGTGVRMGREEPDPADIIRDRREGCNRIIEQARELISQERYGQARRKLDSALRIAVDESAVRTIRDLQIQLNEHGMELLRQADNLYQEGKYLEALDAYERINRDYATLPVGARARAAVDMAEADPRCRQAARNHKASRLEEQIQTLLDVHAPLAETPPESAEEGKADDASPNDPANTASSAAEGPSGTVEVNMVPPADDTVQQTPPGRSPSESGKTSDAKQAVSRTERIRRVPLKHQIRIVSLLDKLESLYPDTPAGKAAKADLHTLRSDEAFMERLESKQQQRQAAMAYRTAKMYDDSGLEGKALEYYRRYLQEYPDSADAAKARVRVRQLAEKHESP